MDLVGTLTTIILATCTDKLVVIAGWLVYREPLWGVKYRESIDSGVYVILSIYDLQISCDLGMPLPPYFFVLVFPRVWYYSRHYHL